MPDGVVIIRRPRRVMLDALASVQNSSISDDDAEQFTECMQKHENGWSPGEAKFMMKHLPHDQRRADWYED